MSDNPPEKSGNKRRRRGIPKEFRNTGRDLTFNGPAGWVNDLKSQLRDLSDAQQRILGLSQKVEQRLGKDATYTDLTPQGATRLALALNDRTREAELKANSDIVGTYTNLAASEMWKKLRVLPTYALLNLSGAKALEAFVNDTSVLTAMREIDPSFDPASISPLHKRILLDAFLLDLFGSEYLKRLWSGAKDLGHSAASKAWDLVRNSSTVRSGKQALENLISGIKNLDPKTALQGIASLGQGARDIYHGAVERIADPSILLDDAYGAGKNMLGVGDEPLYPSFVSTDRHTSSTFAPQTIEMAGKVPVLAPSFYPGSAFYYDSVSLAAIAGWVCPELYPSRLPTDMTQRTAVASAIWTQTFSTGSTGALALFVFPWCPTSAGGAPAASAVPVPSFVLTAPEINIATGVATAATTAYAGPLNSNISSIQAFRLNAISLRITTLPSLNNSSGQVQVGYFTDYQNNTFVTGVNYGFPQIPQNLVSSMPNYELINMKSLDLRQTNSIDGPSDLTMFEIAAGSLGLPSNALSEGWYILVTGAAVSTNIVTLTVSYSYEYIPTASYLPLLNVTYADPGAATVAFISTLIKAFPSVLSLSCDSAKRLASGILSSGCTNFNQLMDFCRGYFENTCPPLRNTTSFVLAAGGEGL